MYLYNTRKEREIYSGSFTDTFTDDPAFWDRYDKLISGLDSSSKKEIIQALVRIKAMLSSDEETMDLFTEKEQVVFQKIEDAQNEIIQLTDNLWAYKGYILPINDFRSESFRDRLGIKMIERKEKLMHKSIIDVGGYIGDSSLVLSELTDDYVYAFEPVKEYFELMHKTVRYNSANIIPVKMVATDETCEKNLSIGEQLFNSTIEEIGNREYKEVRKVKGITIDDFVSQNHLRIGLIKIHAEGAEQAVLRGARRTIETQAPVIIVEINHSESDFYDIKPLLEEYNKTYGFKVYKPINHMLCLGLKLIAEQR